MPAGPAVVSRNEPRRGNVGLALAFAGAGGFRCAIRARALWLQLRRDRLPEAARRVCSRTEDLVQLVGNMKRAVVLQTHYVSTAVKREIGRLEAEFPDDFDIWVTGYCREKGRLDCLSGGRVRVTTADEAMLRELPYPGKITAMNWNDSKGNNDLSLMNFFRQRPDYDDYWFIEYDVRCSGLWSDITDELNSSQADLICPPSYYILFQGCVVAVPGQPETSGRRR